MKPNKNNTVILINLNQNGTTPPDICNQKQFYDNQINSFPEMPYNIEFSPIKNGIWEEIRYTSYISYTVSIVHHRS